MGCLLRTQRFTLLTKGMLADCQPQQVPCGPALFWRAGVGGGVPGQGRLVAAGQSAAAAGGQRPWRAQPPLHPHLLLSTLWRRLHGAPAQEDQVSCCSGVAAVDEFCSPCSDQVDLVSWY